MNYIFHIHKCDKYTNIHVYNKYTSKTFKMCIKYINKKLVIICA